MQRALQPPALVLAGLVLFVGLDARSGVQAPDFTPPPTPANFHITKTTWHHFNFA